MVGLQPPHSLFLVFCSRSIVKNLPSSYPVTSCFPNFRGFLFVGVQGFILPWSTLPISWGIFFFDKKGVSKPIFCKICHCLSGTLLLEASSVSMAMFWNYSACVSKFKAHQITYHNRAIVAHQCTHIHVPCITATFTNAAMVCIRFKNPLKRTGHSSADSIYSFTRSFMYPGFAEETQT